MTQAKIPLYVFIDESGDFNFTPSGSKFYTITAVITHQPWEKIDEISFKRHSILSGEELNALSNEYLENFLCHAFHASEDRQPVRDEFFKLIQAMKYFKAHSIVIRKNKTNPILRDPHKLYSKFTSYLLDYIFKSYICSKLCIFIDRMPINSHKKAFLGAVKSEIKNKQPKKEFRIYFPSSASNVFLQISDYVNWAISRKWERADTRSYDLIKKFLGKPELDIFQKGDMEYYSFKESDPLI